MSLLDEIEPDEVQDIDDDTRPIRGEGMDIRLEKSTNNEDIVLSCVARIPKKYFENLSYYHKLINLNGECDDTFEIYRPVHKYFKSDTYTLKKHGKRRLCLSKKVSKNWDKTVDHDLILKLLYEDENLLFDNFFKVSDDLPPLFPKLDKKIDFTDIEIDTSLWESAWELIDDILAEGDFHYTEFRPYREMGFKGLLLTERDITTWLSFLKSSIPVCLVNEEQMPNLEVPVEFPYKKTLQNETEKDEELLKKRKINGDNRYMEALGVYRSNGNKRDILLCPKRIKETADKLKIPFDYLVTIVYIHELGHAALDETIDLNEEENINEIIKIKINKDKEKIDTNKDKFSFVMEESLANMIMLQYIAWYAELKIMYENLFETAELFVKKQSPAYAFGLYQFNADVDWLSWRNYKASYYEANISNKQRSEIRDKQSEWYDLFGNIMNSDIYRQSFNKLFFDEGNN